MAKNNRNLSELRWILSELYEATNADKGNFHKEKLAYENRLRRARGDLMELTDCYSRAKIKEEAATLHYTPVPGEVGRLSKFYDLTWNYNPPVEVRLTSMAPVPYYQRQNGQVTTITQNNADEVAANLTSPNMPNFVPYGHVSNPVTIAAPVVEEKTRFELLEVDDAIKNIETSGSFDSARFGYLEVD